MDNIEVFITNGVTVLMMVFLFQSRRSSRENAFQDDRVFDCMIWLTAAGAVLETIGFLVDGKLFPGARQLNYLTNSLCMIGTVSIGFLWCCYTVLRIYRNEQLARARARFLCVPLGLDIALVVYNCIRPGILFTVSRENVYHRSPLVVLVYLFLFLYFAYSVGLVEISKRNGIQNRFFPVLYFVGPCVMGTVLQGLFYGISVGWMCAAVAFMFAQIQNQSEDLLIDSLSGLFNRRYIDIVLKRVGKMPDKNLWGIMMDVNGFKNINDVYGHSKGDKAIREMGRILSSSIPENGIAIRYAGDEFILLLSDAEQETVALTMQEVEKNLEKFNETTQEPFRLQVAMGCSRLAPEDRTAENFLAEMDRNMYECKRRYYEREKIDRRKKQLW